MLTPEQLDGIRAQAEEITRPITEYLLEDIARRVSKAGQLTSTASYQIWQAQQLGMSQKEIKKELQNLLKVSSKQISELLTQAAEVGYNFDISNLPTADAIPFDENDSLQQIVDAAVQQAQGDFTNLTQTLGMVDPYGHPLLLQDAYRKCMDFAFEQVFTGAADYNTAIRRATKNLADRGVRVINYESGVHRSIEAATRGNIMGGLGIMQERISQQNHDSFGADGWEISAHSASAPDHEPIQGKQYTDAEYEALNNSLVRRIGTLNCGHAAFPIVIGVSEPQYTDEELDRMREENAKGIDYQGRHYSTYEATQMQRKIERTIRKQKNRILVDEATGDADKLQTDQIRLRRLNEEYKRFSKAADLPLQRERAQVAGFGVKQARAVEKVTVQAEGIKDFAKFRDSVTIIPPFKGDAITHRSLRNNLARSKVGKETIEFINSGKCSVEINYTDEAPEGVRGETFGRSITIYAKNTRTIKATAKTLVHEVTHCKYGIGSSQWAEAVCFAREHIHEHGELTFQDKRNIIKTVKDLYPEHQWRKGGRGNGKSKPD